MVATLLIAFVVLAVLVFIGATVFAPRSEYKSKIRR